MTFGAIFGPVQKLAPLAMAFYMLFHVSYDWLRDNPFNRSAGIAMLVLESSMLILLGGMQMILSIENVSIAKKLRDTADQPATATPESTQSKSSSSSFAGTLALFRAIGGKRRQHRDLEVQEGDMEKQDDTFDVEILDKEPALQAGALESVDSFKTAV